MINAECRLSTAIAQAGLSPRLIRFGIFELDLRSGELRKQGRKIRLEGQPVQILVCLLEKPGELVSREALHAKLWPADTFVNFEHGLNVAVKRLRHALSDSAANPRFVETLPRRGYRFIAPVQALDESGGAFEFHDANTRRFPQCRTCRKCQTVNMTTFLSRPRYWHTGDGRRLPGAGTPTLCLWFSQSAVDGFFDLPATHNPRFDLSQCFRWTTCPAMRRRTIFPTG